MKRDIQLVCIGVSAGAIETLSVVLPALPAATPFAVAVVVHLPPKEDSLLVEIFKRKCHLPVLEAKDKDVIAPGTVWFSPPDYHLLVEPTGTFALSVDEPVNFSRPSIDVLFETASDAYGARVAGVMLTGASRDGAVGAAKMHYAGGLVLVQDPRDASSPVMPQSVLDLITPEYIGTLPDIAAYLHALAMEHS